ncbi:hypothetical protein V2J09_017120 [Rumex salicifolius]
MQKLLEEEKVDSFNTPYYASYPQEVIQLVKDEGSFEVDRIEPFEFSWDGIRETENGFDEGLKTRITRGEKIARVHRAVMEPLMEYHFGKSIMEELFVRYGKMLDDRLSKKEPKFVNLAVTLVRKPSRKITFSTIPQFLYSKIQVFHMNPGAGDVSYARNSSVQNDILLITRPYTEKALRDYLKANKVTRGKMVMADLGCGSGPNALAAVSHMVEVVDATWHQEQGKRAPEVVVYLNDLPGNDFNNVFGSLPSILTRIRKRLGGGSGSCFALGAPGTFHGRLFPRRSLHFVHSSSSLHWLSQVPSGLNKGKINISKTSSKEFVDGYMKQFRDDFQSFLKSRSVEMVGGGRMVLSFMGRRSKDPTDDEDSYLQWELIARSLMTLVSEKMVEGEKVDSFNTPYYASYPEEVIQLVKDEGSFEVDRIESFEINWDGIHETKNEPENGDQGTKIRITRGEKIARVHRAVMEPLMEYHFGKSIMEELFVRYGEMLDARLSTKEPKFVNLVVTLVKKPSMKIMRSTLRQLLYATILKSCH